MIQARQINKILGLTFFVIGLFSCTTTQEINGFGGGFRSFGSKVEPQKNVPQKKEIKTVNPENTTETTAANEIDFENLNCTEKMEVNTITNSKLANLKKAITAPTLKELTKTNSLKKKILTKLIDTKLKHSKSRAKHNKSNTFLPDEDSDLGYWFLFILFCILFSIMALIAKEWFVTGASRKDIYSIGAMIILGIYSLIQLIGLLTYEKLDECGFVYQFGFWTSMVAWWFYGIPLLIWLIGALTC